PPDEPAVAPPDDEPATPPVAVAPATGASPPLGVPPAAMIVPPLPPLPVEVPPAPAEPSLAGELQANKPVTASHVSSLCLLLARPVTVPKRDTTCNFDMARTVTWHLEKINRG